MQQVEKSSRDLRQEQCVRNWLLSKGKGCIVASTGFGFIDFKNGSRSIKEFTESLSGNIGKTPEMDNTEINSEIKESESSYSVEVEN